jgi:hypothetical protein
MFWKTRVGTTLAAALYLSALGYNGFARAQEAAPQTAPVAVAAGKPCCGPITPEGARLAATIDSMHVEEFWQPHVHIEWETGRQDRPDGYTGPDAATHCSAFAAAVGLRLNVYMLRPPEHKLTLLASAQTEWFHTEEGKKAGWFPVESMRQAQMLANTGNLVVIAYESPDPHKPGHIVVVRPSLKTEAQLEKDGPEIAMAGSHNKNDSVAATSFNSHPGAWPNGVKVYAHTVPPADSGAK